VTTIYIAGPMRRHPQFNIPLFDEVAATLRKAGHAVISPAELDSPEIRAEALASPDGIMGATIGGETAGEILGRDVRVVIDHVDKIVFLRGWTQSQGAKLEAFVGLTTGKQFGIYCGYGEVRDVSPEAISRMLKEVMP
jgi:hypothetical protein